MNFRTNYDKIEKQKKKINKVTTQYISIVNKTVVVTGTLPGMTRSEFISFCRQRSILVADNLSSRVDYLIVGKKTTSNLTKKEVDAITHKIPSFSFKQIEQLKHLES